MKDTLTEAILAVTLHDDDSDSARKALEGVVAAIKSYLDQNGWAMVDDGPQGFTYLLESDGSAPAVLLPKDDIDTKSLRALVFSCLMRIGWIENTDPNTTLKTLVSQ